MYAVPDLRADYSFGEVGRPRMGKREYSFADGGRPRMGKREPVEEAADLMDGGKLTWCGKIWCATYLTMSKKVLSWEE